MALTIFFYNGGEKKEEEKEKEKSLFSSDTRGNAVSVKREPGRADSGLDVTLYARSALGWRKQAPASRVTSSWYVPECELGETHTHTHTRLLAWSQQSHIETAVHHASCDLPGICVAV